ncbi:hypothetical protein JCM9279_002702 [Rhodotorula babjevae]
MSAAPPPPPGQLASLTALLATLSRTRASLPALLTAVSTSAAHSPHDRTALYRAASTECSTAVRALADHLDKLEAVLQHAEDSASRDPAGIVVRAKQPQHAPPPPPPPAAEHDEKKPWAALGDILLGGVEATTPTSPTTTAEGKARAPYTPQLGPPTSPDSLVALARTWEEQHPRVRVRVGQSGRGRGARPRRLEVVLEGVMRAAVGLRWEERAGDGGEEGEVCEADWVACHGLAEDRAPFLPSQYSLFQSLTNDATELVDRARVRRAAGQSAAGASVEEVLAFLSDPPLPF